MFTPESNTVTINGPRSFDVKKGNRNKLLSGHNKSPVPEPACISISVSARPSNGFTTAGADDMVRATLAWTVNGKSGGFIEFDVLGGATVTVPGDQYEVYGRVIGSDQPYEFTAIAAPTTGVINSPLHFTRIFPRGEETPVIIEEIPNFATEVVAKASINRNRNLLLFNDSSGLSLSSKYPIPNSLLGLPPLDVLLTGNEHTWSLNFSAALVSVTFILKP